MDVIHKAGEWNSDNGSKVAIKKRTRQVPFWADCFFFLIFILTYYDLWVIFTITYLQFKPNNTVVFAKFLMLTMHISFVLSSAATHILNSNSVL